MRVEDDHGLNEDLKFSKSKSSTNFDLWVLKIRETVP